VDRLARWRNHSTNRVGDFGHAVYRHGVVACLAMPELFRLAARGAVDVVGA
jgi:hypothetical protein